MRNFTADIDECVVRADCIRRNNNTFNERMWVRHHQRDVFAGARLGLICIHNEVVRLSVVLRNETPLHARREASTTTAAKAGILDDLDDLIRIGLQRLLQGVVTMMTRITGECVAVGFVPMRGENRCQWHVTPGFPEAACRLPSRQ